MKWNVNIFSSKNKRDEINLFIKGNKDDKPGIVVGKYKSQPSKRDIDDLDAMIKHLTAHFKTTIHGFIVGYIFDLDVEEYITTNYPKIKYYKTYQVEQIARQSE